MTPSERGSPDPGAAAPDPGSAASDPPAPALGPGEHRPLYARVLRLRHIRLARWQAALLFDGVLVLGVLVALAELATAWAPVLLPAAVAVVVKAYDVIAGAAGPVPEDG